jgi:pilus assembly protein CpaB
MMKRLRAALAAYRNTALFLAALACGAIAVVAGKGYLAEQLEAERARLAPKPPRMRDVIVARHDLAKGDVVSADTMALRRIPEEYVSSSVVLQEQFDAFSGIRLAAPLRSGEQLVASSVVGGDNLAFSHRVRPGIRALSIAVDEVNSISGMLQPGDRIDLLFSARPPAEGDGRSQAPEATVPLFQGLLVLATGRQVRAGVDERGGVRSFSTVTVEVEPEHAQRLVVAQRAGRLTAVLRNPDDAEQMSRKAMDIRQLLGMRPPAVDAAALPQVIVGGLGRLPVYPSEEAAAGAASGGNASPPDLAAQPRPPGRRNATHAAQ